VAINIQTSGSQSFILQRDPRLRVLISLTFAVVIALCQHILTLSLGLLFSLILVVFARIANRNTRRRFAEINLFIILLFIFLPPAIPGTPVVTIGHIIWSSEGILRTSAIALKANSIMLVFAALIATLDPVHLGVALERLGLPNKLAVLFFLTVRYLDVIQQEYRQLVNAITLRGFSPGFTRHTFRTYGYVVGMLVIRSLDRSERIVKAMKCRGFRNRFYTLTTFNITTSDLAFALLCSGVLVGLGYLEWGVR